MAESPESVHDPESAHDPTESASAKASAIGRRARRDKTRDWAIATVTGVVTSIALAFYLSATGQAALTAAGDGFAKPSCANPQSLLQVPDSEIFAHAYYEQMDAVDNFKLFHVAGNTIDGDVNTSWLQFWPSWSTAQGKASSDYIEWSFAHSYDVRLICVVDGWPEDRNTYTQTLPISTAMIYSTDPSSIPPTVGSPRRSGTCAARQASFTDYLHADSTVTFADQWQSVRFHCVTSDLVLRVEGVSKASIANRPLLQKTTLQGYSEPVTGLSEVRFYYCPAILCWLPG
jgi:hypothetical protein